MRTRSKQRGIEPVRKKLQQTIKCGDRSGNALQLKESYNYTFLAVFVLFYFFLRGCFCGKADYSTDVRRSFARHQLMHTYPGKDDSDHQPDPDMFVTIEEERLAVLFTFITSFNAYTIPKVIQAQGN